MNPSGKFSSLATLVALLALAALVAQAAPRPNHSGRNSGFTQASHHRSSGSHQMAAAENPSTQLDNDFGPEENAAQGEASDEMSAGPVDAEGFPLDSASESAQERAAEAAEAADEAAIGEVDSAASNLRWSGQDEGSLDGLDSNIANAKVRLSSSDMATAAGHHHGKKHYVSGWLKMGAETGKKGAFKWHDKHPVGGKGRR